MSRKVDQLTIDLIKQFEGFVDHIYICPAGWPTLGYGHVVTPTEKELYKDGITEPEACDLLAKDLEGAEKSVSRLIAVPLTDHQYGALVSFTFNLGGGALQSSTLRMVLNRGEYANAAEEFKKWKYARVGGVMKVLPGLVTRRQIEHDMFEMEMTNEDEEEGD